jgi:hypothetical protein
MTDFKERLLAIRNKKWNWVSGMVDTEGWRVFEIDKYQAPIAVLATRHPTLNYTRAPIEQLKHGAIPDLTEVGTLAYLEHQIGFLMDEPGWCPFLCAEGWALPFTDPTEHGAYATRGEAVLVQLEIL